MSKPISHSAINKYLQCGESYRLHYVEKLRPIAISSALLFGSAIGKAFEHMLHNRDFNAAFDVFQENFTCAEVNKEKVFVPDYPHVIYSKYDYDKDLFDELDDTAEKDLSFVSLNKKAVYILKSFEENFLPKVKKVYSTEEKAGAGFSDAVLELHDTPGVVIIDFKTAARDYESDAVRKSIQLSQYVHELGPKYNTRTAGYAVFAKNISKNRVKKCSSCGYDGSETRHKTCSVLINGKRCNGAWTETTSPESRMQLLIEELPVATENFVVGNIKNVQDAIEKEVFVKNVNNCWDNGFGRACEYVNLCWGGDKSEFITVKDDKVKS